MIDRDYSSLLLSLTPTIDALVGFVSDESYQNKRLICGIRRYLRDTVCLAVCSSLTLNWLLVRANVEVDEQKQVT